MPPSLWWLKMQVRTADKPPGANGLSTDDLQMSRCALDDGLQGVPGSGAHAGGVPEVFQHLVAFPPVAMVEQVQAVQIFVTGAPRNMVQIGQHFSGSA